METARAPHDGPGTPCGAGPGLVLWVALVLSLGPAGCSDPAATPAAPGPAAAPPGAWAVRGRLDRAEDLRVFVDDLPGATSGAALRAAVAAACRTWSAAADGVGMRVVDALGEADVVVGFRPREHAGCPPFRTMDGEIAHAGPVRRPSFVHLDAGTAFTSASRDAGTAPRLETVVLHELGHVLGLDHPGVAGALMSAAYRGIAPELTAADRAGLQSLYGGGEDGPGDLAVHPLADDDTPGPARTILRRALGAGAAWVPFDADGDGRDEILGWSAPGDRVRALRLFRFDAGGRLEATRGPLHGILSPGVRVAIGRDPGRGERLLVHRFPGGRVRAVGFDGDGLPLRRLPGDQGFRLEGGPCDADGDGIEDPAEETGPPPAVRELGPGWTCVESRRQGSDTVWLARDGAPGASRYAILRDGGAGTARAPAVFEAPGREARLADLDGDGSLEVVLSRR